MFQRVNKLVCYRCGSKFDGPYRKASGPALGSMITDQLVCPVCQEAHSKLFEERFWKGAAAQPRTKCAKCGGELADQIGGLVPHQLQESGAWTYAVICRGCHVQYVALCQEASKPRR